MRRRTGSLVPLLVAVTLGVAACSGGSSNGSGSSTAGSSSIGGALSSGGSSTSSTGTTTPSSTTSPAATSPTSAPSTVSTAPVGGPPPCATSSLAGALASENAGAGSVFTTVTLTNHGSTTCTLYGYPGVSLSLNGSQLGQPATRAAGYGPVLVTLAPGQSAPFVLHTNSSVAGPCQSASTIIVFPPNQRAALSIPAGLQLCGTLLETTAVGHVP